MNQKASSLPDRIRDFYVAQHKGVAAYQVELKRLAREKDLAEWVESLRKDIVDGKWKSAREFFDAPTRNDPKKSYGTVFTQNGYTDEELDRIIIEVDGRKERRQIIASCS